MAHNSYFWPILYIFYFKSSKQKPNAKSETTRKKSRNSVENAERNEKDDKVIMQNKSKIQKLKAQTRIDKAVEKELIDKIRAFRASRLKLSSKILKQEAMVQDLEDENQRRESKLKKSN